MADLARSFNWGIVGTGRAASDFAQALQTSKEACLLAVASRDADRAKAFACAVGARHGVGDYTELLKIKELDVIYIATPNHRHKSDCLAAIPAADTGSGEKPLCRKPALAR